MTVDWVNCFLLVLSFAKPPKLTASPLAAVKHPSPLSWARRSQLRHHSESIMFLSANVFGELLLEPNSQPEVQQIAQDTLIAARSVVRTVLQSPAYTSSVKFCGFLFKVSFDWFQS